MKVIATKGISNTFTNTQTARNFTRNPQIQQLRPKITSVVEPQTTTPNKSDKFKNKNSQIESQKP